MESHAPMLSIQFTGQQRSPDLLWYGTILGTSSMLIVPWWSISKLQCIACSVRSAASVVKRECARHPLYKNKNMIITVLLKTDVFPFCTLCLTRKCNFYNMNKIMKYSMFQYFSVEHSNEIKTDMFYPLSWWLGLGTNQMFVVIFGGHTWKKTIAETFFFKKKKSLKTRACRNEAMASCG